MERAQAGDPDAIADMEVASGRVDPRMGAPPTLAVPNNGDMAGERNRAQLSKVLRGDQFAEDFWNGLREKMDSGKELFKGAGGQIWDGLKIAGAGIWEEAQQMTQATPAEQDTRSSLNSNALQSLMGGRNDFAKQTAQHTKDSRDELKRIRESGGRTMGP
jgi:hypothetical protein